MTPEEKFNQEVWWILQEIKKEQLATPKGEKVYFPLRLLPKTASIRRKEVDYGIPPADTQRKILYKLKEWNALNLEPTGMYFDDPFSPPTAYLLTTLEKFDELYRLYENGGFYSENQKTTAEFDSSQSIIKPKSLELIAKEIGDLDSGSNLVEFLTNCGVKREFIEYPNTKWRMVYSVLLTLASLQNKEDRKILFKIIEGACHPLMYGGDKNLAKKTADKFNSFLEYDNFFIKDGVLWEGWDDGAGLSWSDKDGNNFEDKLSYLIIPQQMDKLYVYWNELIKLAKFYFNNKDSQDDEINDIYFEIIANVEELLNGNGCDGLKEKYKKPFRNMIGCEFEIQKQGLTTDGLFVNLYDFLGEITECSLPDKNNVEKIKKEDAAFLAKIQDYVAQHLNKKELAQKTSGQGSSTTKIEITKIPELQIKGLEEKIILQKPKNKRIQLRKFPTDTKWNDIVIQFLNDHEVIVRVKNETHQTTYEAMGFQDEKKKLPNKQWQFLRLLAFKNGEISWENNRDLSLQQINSIKKQKQLLTEALKAYFQIYDDEPFYDYKKEKAYKIKLNLVPENNTKITPNEQEIFKEDDELGIKESYKEQTPEIYEK